MSCYIYKANKDTILDGKIYIKGQYISKENSPTNSYKDASISVYYYKPMIFDKNFDAIPVYYKLKVEYSEEIKLI